MFCFHSYESSRVLFYGKVLQIISKRVTNFPYIFLEFLVLGVSTTAAIIVKVIHSDTSASSKSNRV